MADKGETLASKDVDPPSTHQSADLSVWAIWGVIMLLAVAVLPFAVRNQDVVRAIANMCGFDIG